MEAEHDSETDRPPLDLYTGHATHKSAHGVPSTVELGAESRQRENGVLARSESQSFQSDDSFSSSQSDDPALWPSVHSFGSGSTETQESAFREITPSDMFKLSEETIITEDFGLSEPTLHEHRVNYSLPEYYQDVSHATDIDKSLTTSFPKKAYLWGLDTINKLLPFKSPKAVDPGLGEPFSQNTRFSRLDSTSVREQIVSTSSTHRNMSPGLTPEMDGKEPKGSFDVLQDVPGQNSPETELSLETLGSHVNHSLPSPLPITFNSSHPSSLGNSSNVTEYDSTNSSDFEEDLAEVDHGVLEPLRLPILDGLLEIFFKQFSLLRCQRNDPPSENTEPRPQCCPRTQTQSEPTSKDPLPSTLGKRGRKGSNHHHSGGEEDEEDDEDKYPRKRLHLDRPAEVQPIFWACPFSKWKPLSYRKCCQYILRDISRVKQHLRRYHERPPYCPVCWEVFREEDGFESHMQSRSCSPRPKPDLEGVTAVQQKQLERRSDKQLSKSEQWYAIFTILFPGQPHPDSPYLESDLSSELLSLQTFMATDGLPFVERMARERISPDLMPHHDEVVAFTQTLFQQAIPEILRMYDTTRPIYNVPEIPRRPVLPSVGGNDYDSGYGTLSQTSHDRNSGNQGQDIHEAQDNIITDRPNYTNINVASIDDVRIQASRIEGQVLAYTAQSQDIPTIRAATHPQQPIYDAALDLPSEFTFEDSDAQLFGLGGAATGFADGQYIIWDATFNATLENDASSTSTGQI
ncbi:hypothetical protein Daesc_005402 [Daldinia eschscholtzii]|uniref:C2H2-type domain-containing protein n=1 Tax=Daldinia eschscholtzii TaxID=292717 RepID=A0AAX6MLP6_9PEZI